ncbi:hypothetical protein [Pseudalkalibacillus berkeleyi]|uniref:3-methyladenine DNA glycosylase n=1 Tax=Pseudalkalibacillus berkeleyi TaxID=1069813 RepID=A0ABS9GTN9_9BACL|nr:hypothetical protein [Pseudalkalibacillus berkeleyi]MCF6136219.1 hypothetical protein [Pseudalkalibacillus berkeleyi]
MATDKKDKKKREEPDHTLHEDETVDPIPVEDQKQEVREEKQKDKTKDDSSSEKKYRKDE